MSETTVTAEALNDLRQRYLDGKSWTREELKNAIFTMIGDRLASVQATPQTKAAKATPVSLDDMLPEPKAVHILPAKIEADGSMVNQVPKATEPKAASPITSVHRGVDTGVKTATEERTPAPKKSTGGFF